MIFESGNNFTPLEKHNFYFLGIFCRYAKFGKKKYKSRVVGFNIVDVIKDMMLRETKYYWGDEKDKPNVCLTNGKRV